MKTYFINVDFDGPGFSKFAFAVIKADLNEKRLIDIAKTTISGHCEKLNVNVDEVVINVTAFNEITT